jgi:hypothetical protein
MTDPGHFVLVVALAAFLLLLVAVARAEGAS